MGSSSSGRARSLVLTVITLLAFAALAGAAHAQSAPDPANPNDPDFAGCEHQNPIAGCKDSEQWDLFGQLTGDDCPVIGDPAPDRFRPHPDGGLPCWAFIARDPQHAAGINTQGAWAQGNVGRDDVLVAYIEGGVNYSSDSIRDGLDGVYLNKGELPYPQRADGTNAGAYDLNGDGNFDIRDWADDPRVNPKCAAGVAPFSKYQDGTTRGCRDNGQHGYLNKVTIGGAKTAYLSPEDLIAVFGHCRISGGAVVSCPKGGRFDNDGNGYPNDVSGWNFDRNTNDPQTEDLDYNHAPGLVSLLGGQADNGFSGVGVCRECRVVPIKQSAECLGRTDRWGESILYAADLGATVVSSVVVGYQYSAFNQRAIDYAYNKGVVLSLDSNDFDAMDHTDGMLWNHVMPGNSLAEDKGGPAANATSSFRARSNVTSYGTHNVFSGGEYTTSGATPFQAGFFGMVQAAGLNARDKGVLPTGLTPNEIKQVLMDTASPVIPQTQSPESPDQWPGNPDSATDADHTNWSTQYGYGRPDVGAATKLVMEGKVPPTADMTGPRWFSYVDPTTTKSLDVVGSVAPSRVNSGGSAHWVLEWALGADPADADFHAIARGDGVKRGLLGRFDLTKIPSDYYTKAPGVTLQPDGAEQYTVTLRLRVKDANGLKGEDRRSIGVRHDPDLVPGFPKSVGAEMGMDPTYVDLEGRHELDLVFGTYNGDLHALRPDGHEARGFPVHTDTLRSIDPLNPQNFRGAAAYRSDPVLRTFRDGIVGVAVGDIFRDGRQEIVASTENGFVYVWSARGRRESGFPVHTDPAFWNETSPTPRAPTRHGRVEARGSLAPPVLADLEGTGHLDVIMPAYDGHVYAWRPDGEAVPGWPVEIKLPEAVFQRDSIDKSKYIRDPKLMYSVAVGDVLGKGSPQVFVSSFECSGADTSEAQLAGQLLGLSQGADNSDAKAYMYGVWADGRRHAGGPYLPNWPVAVPAGTGCYDQSIDFVGEGAGPPLIAKVDGAPRVFATAFTGPVVAYSGDGSVFKQMSSDCRAPDCGADPPYRPGDTHTITITGQGGFGDLDNDGTPEYIQSTTGLESILSALSVPGIATVPQVYEKAWNPSDGSVIAGFPRRQDGFPFYGAPLIADLAGDGTRAAIESNDTYWIHAYEAAGGEAPGFPKYTGQWVGFGAVVGDTHMDGHLTYATVTREGDVFAWRVKGDPKLNNNWWHYRHDERNTGSYGTDTRPPATVRDVRMRPAGRSRLALSWRATGDDGIVGRPRRYEVVMSRRRSLRGARRLAVVHARRARVRAVRGRWYAIRAVDDAGNVSVSQPKRAR